MQVTTGSQPYVPQKVIRQILLETVSKNMQDQQVTGENQRGFTKGELCLMWWGNCLAVEGKQWKLFTFILKKLSTQSPIASI